MTIIRIEEAEPPTRFASHPLWGLGFRPFYLLAALFAALSVPLWLWFYLGAGHGLSLPGLQIDLFWHMHEMVFGFALAVIVGFLFTAMRNWTGLWTPRHGHLAALAGLWLAGRVALLLAPPHLAALAALIDIAFLPLAAWPLYGVLRRSNNKRNMFLIALLAGLALCNVAFHAVRLGWLALSPTLAVQAAILIIVLIESVIGARVIPMFTANGAPGSEPQVSRLRDRISLVLTILTVLAWIIGVPLGLPAATMAALALATASAVLVRVLGWQPQRTVGIPLLWILHVSYAWIAAGFFLLALAALHQVSMSAAFHALTVGSMAGLIMGMITRTTLGHTGRPLVAGRAELAMYCLIQLGAVARVASALISPAWHQIALLISGFAWSAAFLLYVWVYAPYLWRARVDGREG